MVTTISKSSWIRRMDGLLAARMVLTAARVHLRYDTDWGCWVIWVD